MTSEEKQKCICTQLVEFGIPNPDCSIHGHWTEANINAMPEESQPERMCPDCHHEMGMKEGDHCPFCMEIVTAMPEESEKPTAYAIPESLEAEIAKRKIKEYEKQYKPTRLGEGIGLTEFFRKIYDWLDEGGEAMPEESENITSIKELVVELLVDYYDLPKDEASIIGKEVEGIVRLNINAMPEESEIAKRMIEEYRQQPDYPFGDNIHSWDKLEDFESWLDKGGE